jgi:Repeat of Unknown Function (DUF347)
MFWVIKIVATMFGETGGDAVTMTLNLGYAIGSLIFLGFFAVTLTAVMAAIMVLLIIWTSRSVFKSVCGIAAKFKPGVDVCFCDHRQRFFDGSHQRSICSRFRFAQIGFDL